VAPGDFCPGLPTTLSTTRANEVGTIAEHLIKEACSYRERDAHEIADSIKFMLAQGRVYSPAPRPRGMRQWAMKKCYRNAAELAMRSPDRWQYCEGYATSVGRPRPGGLGRVT
jgi:hypothetical protein